MRVSELTGAALDMRVAMAEGLTARLCNDKSYVIVDKAPYAPSTNPDTGYRIIEREHIATAYYPLADNWHADHPANVHDLYSNIGASQQVLYFGETVLIAAMRAFVASKFGEHVDAA